MTFRTALHIVFDVSKRAHRHVQKTLLLKAVLPKPPRVAFRNPKTLRDKLVRSKLKLTDDAERDILIVTAYVFFLFDYM